MRARRIRFAYAPPPVEGETLGSWVHRLAKGQETCGSMLVGGIDVDWNPPERLLAWLAEGGDQPVERLRAMTLSAKYPNLTRRAFARSRGAIFPACHAYCPLCAHEDQRLHGETILRAANAGLWRVSCRRHRCLLDSAEREDEVRPHADVAERVWLNGANKSHRPAVAAAPVALAIERALERTAAGRDPGPEWLERDPNRFNDAARVLSNVVLVTRRAGSDRPSPAWALLGARYPDLYGLGVADYRPSLLRELPAWLRVRAIVAAGRLLLAPSAFEHFGEDLWWSPPFSQRDFVGRPWRVATGAMSLALCEALWPTSADWSGPLRQEIRAVVRDRLAQVGKPAPR